MKLFKSLALIAVLMMAGLNLQAQKFGYIDSQSLLVQHPDVKAADAQIKTFSDQMIAKGQEMVKSFETKYQAYIKAAETNTLSPLQMQEREAALGQDQQKIQAFEVEMQQKVAQERERLYGPILEKVKTAIDALGKEEGYTMIFDTSQGSLVFAMPGDDLMPKVKSRLGF